jgi:prophage antirepressor-like protein
MNTAPIPAGIIPTVGHFTFEGHPIRVIVIGGEPWASLQDFWLLLGHPNPQAEKFAKWFNLPYCRVACRDGGTVQTAAYADMLLLADFWERAVRLLEADGETRLFPGGTEIGSLSHTSFLSA